MTRAVVAAIVLASCAAVLVAQRRPAAPPLRFHHVHYRVDDPGKALGAAAARLSGARTIAQGLGVGVRVGREYVLFDRATGESDRQRPHRSVSDAYVEGMRWLATQGFIITPAAFSETGVSAGIEGAAFDHVAFAADDLQQAVAAIRERPFARTEEAARFRLRSGAIVEIVRDADRPDAFWCPMHPDIRTPSVGKCPLCAMALVPIPAPAVGEYRLDVSWLRRADGSASGIRLTVADPASDARVTRFLDVHERQMHLFVIGRDLQRFDHLHPVAMSDGAFELVRAFEPGAYMLVADFLPASGTPQLAQRVIVTPDYSGPLFSMPPPLESGPNEHVVDGLRIRLDTVSLPPRRAADLRFAISDARSGKPITDLEPYLGAAGHLLIVNQDLTAAIHGHPEGTATAGPVVTFGPVLPAPGRYKMWVQFQRLGAVVTAPFVIKVPESR